MDQDSQSQEEIEKKNRIIKQLMQTVCICNGVPLKNILPHITPVCDIESVNQKAGTGSGGCKGERCGPKIRALIAKKKSQSK